MSFKVKEKKTFLDKPKSEKGKKGQKTKREGEQNKGKKQVTVSNMVAINSTISIINLNINDLISISIKRQVIRVDQKIICCLQKNQI